MGGHVIMYLNGPLLWAANIMKIAAQSSCESETHEASRATKNGLFMRNLITNNRRRLVGPTLMLGDNAAMMDVIKHEGASTRTRYFDRVTLLVKRAYQLLMVDPTLITTDNMIADIFTKSTDKGTFCKMRNAMMNINSTLVHALESSLCAFHGATKKLMSHLFDRVN